MTTLDTTTTSQPISMKRVWLTMVVVILAEAMDFIDSTITNVAAPSIVQDLGADPSLIKWLGAAYALALGSLLVLGGRIGDRFGQRRSFLIGMTGFVLSSAAAGLAFDPTVLIVARVAQGSFGALLIPQSIAIMTATFPKPALQKAFGLFAPMLGVFAVGGPILGGVIIDADLFGLQWRPIFLINIVLGGTALVFALLFLPYVEPRRSTRIDVWGSLLLAVSLFGILFGLIDGTSDGWGASAIGSIAIGAVLFAGFIWRQGHTDQPLLPRSLLARRTFSSGLVVGMLLFITFSGLSYVLSLHFQLTLHYSPTGTSIALIPLTVGIVAGSILSTFLLPRLGRRLIAISLFMTIAGVLVLLVLVTTVGTDVQWWQNAIATFVIGSGAGVQFSSIFATALGDVEAHEAGSASGSLNAVQQVANGIGSAIVTSVFFAALAGGGIHAITITLVVVLCITAACLGAVPLLPRKAAELED